MKIVIHPAYEHLREFIAAIPAHAYATAELIRDNRNIVERVEAPGGTMLVVKHFKKPPLIKRLVYSTLTMSKARRSYEYSLRLAQMGIDNAEPAAYIEIERGGLFHTGYYISKFIDAPLLYDLGQGPERAEVLMAFAEYTAGLHIKGVQHNDYNPKNIFFRRDGDGYRFSMVDLNRIRFKRRLTRCECIKEFRRLGFPTDELAAIADRYARVRGWNRDLFCGCVLLARALDPHWKMKRFFKAVIHPFSRRKNNG